MIALTDNMLLPACFLLVWAGLWLFTIVTSRTGPRSAHNLLYIVRTVAASDSTFDRDVFSVTAHRDAPHHCKNLLRDGHHHCSRRGASVLKRHYLLTYALIELAVGLVVAINTMRGLSDNIEPIQIAGMASAVYIFIRGMDNVSVGYERRRAA